MCTKLKEVESMRAETFASISNNTRGALVLWPFRVSCFGMLLAGARGLGLGLRDLHVSFSSYRTLVLH